MDINNFLNKIKKENGLLNEEAKTPEKEFTGTIRLQSALGASFKQELKQWLTKLKGSRISKEIVDELKKMLADSNTTVVGFINRLFEIIAEQKTKLR